MPIKMLRFLTSWMTPLVALLAYLLFWPVPIDPQGWDAPKAPGYTGPHAANTRLSSLTQWPLGDGREGPEHITAYHGAIYTATHNGDVLRIDESGTVTKLLNTGGRPLGLDISSTGRMYIADAFKGLLTVNLMAPTLEAKPLVTTIDMPLPEDPIRYADAVALDKAGNVWFTDASRRFSPAEHGGTFEASVLDILEHSCTGRLLVIDPVTERKRVALQGLCFPNGLAFSADGQSMFLAETGTFRIIKVDLARLSVARSSVGMTGVPSLKNALDQGAATVLIDNLPGYPDNLTAGDNGRIWVGLTKPRSSIVDFAADQPWLRSMMLRLPRAAWPVPKAYGHIIAFDEAGRIVDDLQDPQGRYPETTAATEMNGRLYVQSLHARTVGWMPYPARSPAN